MKYNVILIDDKKNKMLKVKCDNFKECIEYKNHIVRHFKNRYRIYIEEV